MKLKSMIMTVGLLTISGSVQCWTVALAQSTSTNGAKLPAQSFLTMGGIVTTPERRASPHFEGKELPLPPEQKATWSSPSFTLSTNYVSATSALFEEGMADPRGCEYREIEVGTGNVWNGDSGIVKTRGWLLPAKAGQRFAVCWNGLVYPVVGMGESADWRADARAAIQRTSRRWAGALPEGLTVSHEACLPLKGCLLLRLSEPALAKEMWASAQLGNQRGFDAKPGATLSEVDAVKLNEVDPYLDWASEWAWGLFERAICAHMRRDDGLALASARLLAAARPQIEAEAERRGFKRERTFNSPWDGKYQDYLNFLGPLPALLTDQVRRERRHEPVLSITDAMQLTNQATRILALMDQLDQVAVRQSGQPGGLWPWRDDAIVSALVKEGQPAVEPLFQCLENECANRLTRSVSFGRDFHRGRWVHPVSEPVVSALHDILKVTNFGEWATPSELASAGTNGNRVAAIQIRAWMRKFAGNTPEERWYITLADDSAGMKLWMDAANNITKPIRSDSPATKSLPAMQGESLRNKANPSVTDLMDRRIRATTPTEFPDSGQFFRFGDARNFALMLSKWDSTGAIPTLRWQMNRAREFSESSNSFMRDYGQGVFITTIVDVTLARIRGGDTKALVEYAAWLQSRKPGQAFIDHRSGHSNSAESLSPACQFPDDPAIVSALEKLLANPDSPWRPSLVATNGTIGLAGELVSTPLLGREVVRRYMLAGLAEKTQAGVVIFSASPSHTNDATAECKFDVGWTTWQNVERTNKLPSDTKQPMPFRICDLFAEQLASVEGAPPFVIYWSLDQRDKAIKALTEFVEQQGTKLSDLIEQKRKRE